MNAIESVGAYVPRYRITAETIAEAWDGFRARGIREKRVPAADEDVITMAVEAAKNALARSAVDRTDLTTIALGTTTPPFEEGDVGVQVAGILGLKTSVETNVFTQSTRAGTRALLTALRANAPALAIAADCPVGMPAAPTDHAAGAGSVACVLAGEGVQVVETATAIREAPGIRFRRRGSKTVETYGATAYEREAYTATIATAVDRLTGVPAALAPTAFDGTLPGRAGRATGIAEVFHCASEFGDVGATSPLFGLLEAWAAGTESVAVVGYGGGSSADALAVEGCLPVDWKQSSETITYAEYLRKRGSLHSMAGGGD